MNVFDKQVVMLVPRRSDSGSYRDIAWDWVKNFWQEKLPNLQIFVGEPDPGPFNRSQAVNKAAKAAGGWDLAVVADADSFANPAQLIAAIETADEQGHVIFAFNRFCYLSEEGSQLAMDGERSLEPYVEYDYEGRSSLLVVPRPVWDAVGGFDEGFVGWGEEDIGFYLASQTMAWDEGYPPIVSIPGECWHLWHPISGTINYESAEFLANKARGARYIAAADNREAMREVINELYGEWRD